MTKFDGSRQSKDLTLPPNCGGFGRVHHFRRSQGEGWPLNPLPIDPALHALGVPTSDLIQVQLFQNAICSWRCWYCFVDFDLLSGNLRHSEFKTVDELIELYLKECERPRIIDLSGGQPDLVPEWTLWFTEALDRRGMAQSVYLWSDDNLSNDYLWRYLTQDQINELVSRQNYGRVGCFKGFDGDSFSFNTQASADLFPQQFQLMRRLVDLGFDVYGYATFTARTDASIAHAMRDFVDRLQEEIHPLFPLRTIPLRIRNYTPTKGRLNTDRARSLEIQRIAVDVWTEEIARRYPAELRNKPIYEHSLLVET